MIVKNQAPDISSASVLHLTADYPDMFGPDKTTAVKSLIALVDDAFDQRVISLNRTNPTFTETLKLATTGDLRTEFGPTSGRIQPMRYSAPPYGIFHHRALMKLTDRVEREIARGRMPDLIMAHKLTVEGLVAAELASRHNLPYAILIQGNSDTKIASARPDLRHVFRRVLHGADLVCSFAPWGYRSLAQLLKTEARHVINLPCPILEEQVIPPRTGNGTITTAFHPRNFKTKNLPRLVDAMELVRARGQAANLTVIGGQGCSPLPRRTRVTASSAGWLTMTGLKPNKDMPALYNESVAFALPSLRESFGMVFIEALFAGCPILYPSDRAIDGYLQKAPFAISVDPYDTKQIAESLLRLFLDETAIKHELAKWQMSGEIEIFKRGHISAALASGISSALCERKSNVAN